MNFGRLPIGPVRQQLRERATAFDVHRPTETTADWGERKDDYTTHTADIDVFAPQDSEVQLPTGEITDQSLGGMVLAGADVEPDDLIEYEGQVLEIVNKTPYPAALPAEFYRLGLTTKHDTEPSDLP